jgi:tRNA pseudouridine13 synthase
MNDALPARAHGEAALTARIRSVPEDFAVDEIDAFVASGAGEHLLLTVEKRGMNTAFAAKRIAAWAGVAESAIGYAGLKDRHALTRQRFSVWIPKTIAPDIDALQSEDLRVLEHAWHSRKLPRGALAGNRFALTLREVEGDTAAIEARLNAIAERGVPNYFGEQRFGRGGDNVSKALSMFAGRRVAREERGHLLSAARSELFNRVLAARVAASCWDTGLDGEVWVLDGSRSVFGPEPWSDMLAERLARFDIHPSGPLWGRGELRTQVDARALELATLDDEHLRALREGLERAGMDQERRALRLRPEGLDFDWPEPGVLRLRFSLPAGCYATTVLAELGTVVGTAAGH